MKITDEARGRPCTIRLPGCTGGGEDSVWCHFPVVQYIGMGMKVPDILGAFGCSHCHDLVDSRKGQMMGQVKLLAFATGVMRTQAQLWREGKLKYEP